MAFLDIFKSSAKAVDVAADVVTKSTDGIISGLDKMVFTEEEKSDVKQKWFDKVIDFQKALMQEALPSAISRRVLAWMIAGVYLVQATAASIIWRFNKEWAQFIIDNILGRIEFAFSAVISTYFIYHGLKQVVKK